MNLEYDIKKISLNGTPPQVKWATAIRQKKVAELKSMGVRHWALAVKPLLTDAMCKKMGIASPAHATAFVYAVARYLVSCPDASWWILHRDDKPLDWMPAAVKQCVAHFSKTKPFK